jgi:hypothetical protein
MMHRHGSEQLVRDPVWYRGAAIVQVKGPGMKIRAGVLHRGTSACAARFWWHSPDGVRIIGTPL